MFQQQKIVFNIVQFSLQSGAKITFVIAENIITIRLLTIDKNLNSFYGDFDEQQ